MFKFLAGLGSEYEHIRAQILNMNLSSLNEVYGHVHREEGRRRVTNMSFAVEKSSFISISTRGSCGGSFTGGHGRCFGTSNDRDHLNCEYCGRSRRTKN